MWRVTRIVVSTLLATVSLVVLVAAIVMWVRSRHVRDYVTWTDAAGRTRSLDSVAGTVQFVETAPSGNGFGLTPPQTPSRSVLHQAVPGGGDWRTFWGTQAGDVTWGAAGFVVISRSYPVYPPGGFSGSSGFSGFGGSGFGRATGTTSALGVVVPCWAIALLAAPLPIRGAYRVRRWQRTARRVRAGWCAACGYDLRATPERCPECGTASATPV